MDKDADAPTHQRMHTHREGKGMKAGDITYAERQQA
jgi:hypothetical protein